ncbi:DUF6585 family protein [Rahnella bonaserana]|jgi:hypothetical protein|uniref:DUF3137 domain-containing protein n=1 Tax=Rahnella bonaserana TaxID=2816248 RepID=A0ABS6LTE7_9GAMM|nr:DUF6585 family protein [Rahnella bonaserana]MBU9855319.1 hypothetical protein [Rahnella bonaserana]MCL9643043.1 hypothetical protein [Rahnella victoriana]WHZ39839.1 hypothetical protein QNM34_17670 [Rahnella bonaserana]
MINEGRLLSQHGFAKANSWITLVLSVLLLVGGAVQIAFFLAFGHTADGLHSVVVSALLSIALGVVLILLRRLIRPNQVYQLHENGILVISQLDKKNRFIPFDRISDIYRFRTGKYTRRILNTMMFREENSKTWHRITPNIANSERLIDVIKNEQLMFRGPWALNTLAQGGDILFTCMVNSHCGLKRFIGSNLLTMNEKRIRLSALMLTTDEGKTIPVEDIQFISGGSNSPLIRLLDKHGRILFSVAYTSLSSADLFIALIEHMIQNRIPVRN